MSATEIIEQFKNLPDSEQLQVAKFVVEHNRDKAHAGMGLLNAKEAFDKWRGRGRLPAGKTPDEYLHLTRDANGS